MTGLELNRLLGEGEISLRTPKVNGCVRTVDGHFAWQAGVRLRLGVQSACTGAGIFLALRLAVRLR